MKARRLLVDENIPRARAAFGTLGAVRCMAGRSIGPAEVRETDILIVRSVTPVGATLLEDSPVQFVGSATAGTDHIDRAYLERRGIAFAHAPGANASSVADYVAAALLAVAEREGVALCGRTAGVIGCGNVGSRVARRLEGLGMRVLKNDPPLRQAAEREGEAHDFVSLDRVLADADLVTLHVPLTTGGPHATHHLIGAEELRAMTGGTWLVNTARGGVVDSEALRTALDSGGPGAAILDVWEGEPTPDAALVRQAALVTPHIAGYACDGKVEGTAMIYRALCRHLGLEPRWSPEEVLATEGEAFQLDVPDPSRSETSWAAALARQMYDIEADDRRMRQALRNAASEGRGAAFSRLRRDYPRRRAFSRYRVLEEDVPEGLREVVEKGLDVQLS